MIHSKLRHLFAAVVVAGLASGCAIDNAPVDAPETTEPSNAALETDGTTVEKTTTTDGDVDAAWRAQVNAFFARPAIVDPVLVEVGTPHDDGPRPHPWTPNPEGGDSNTGTSSNTNTNVNKSETPSK